MHLLLKLPSFSKLQEHYVQADEFNFSGSSFVYFPCSLKRPIYITALDSRDFCQIISTLSLACKEEKHQSKFNLMTPPSKLRLEEF